MKVIWRTENYADLLKSLCFCKLSQSNFMDLVFIHHNILQLRYFSKIERDYIL